MTGVATWRFQTLTRPEKEGTTSRNLACSCKLRFTSIDRAGKGRVSVFYVTVQQHRTIWNLVTPHESQRQRYVLHFPTGFPLIKSPTLVHSYTASSSQGLIEPEVGSSGHWYWFLWRKNQHRVSARVLSIPWLSSELPPKTWGSTWNQAYMTYFQLFKIHYSLIIPSFDAFSFVLSVPMYQATRCRNSNEINLEQKHPVLRKHNVFCRLSIKTSRELPVLHFQASILQFLSLTSVYKIYLPTTVWSSKCTFVGQKIVAMAQFIIMLYTPPSLDFNTNIRIQAYISRLDNHSLFKPLEKKIG